MDLLQISPASYADYPELGRLHHACHSQSYQAFASEAWLQSRNLDHYLEHWEQLLRDQHPREQSWIARLPAAAVGTVTIKSLGNSSVIFQSRDFQPEDLETSACLRLMYVHPAHQRTGIGRTLILKAHQFCLQEGYRSATLITHAAHKDARLFYEAQGWRLDEIFQVQVEEFFQEPEEMQLRARYRIDFGPAS